MDISNPKMQLYTFQLLILIALMVYRKLRRFKRENGNETLNFWSFLYKVIDRNPVEGLAFLISMPQVGVAIGDAIKTLSGA